MDKLQMPNQLSNKLYMSRVAVDWRSASKKNYEDFCKKHPLISLTFDEWRNILYGFNESFKHYILETGEKEKLPTGFGEFSVNKKKRRKTKDINGKPKIFYQRTVWQDLKQPCKNQISIESVTDVQYFQ